MADTEKLCRCNIVFDGEAWSILYCPLHAAAPDGLKLAKAVLAGGLVLATSSGSDVPCFDEYDREVESKRKGTAILDLQAWNAVRQLARRLIETAEPKGAT